MIRITLLYRRTDDSHFDFDYYVGQHISMAKRLLSGLGLAAIEVEKCLRAMDGSESDVVCMTHIDFESEDAFTDALTIHGAELKADFPKYTNIDPEIYVCEVL
jgi:uncharacterized protein (TIGR02118 family)